MAEPTNTVTQGTGDRRTAPMRLQLAINVADLDDSVAFYTRMFGTAPMRLRPGYANFAITDPPLKLVLFEGSGPPGSINHLGVEMPGADEVRAVADRLRDLGMDPTSVDDTDCCYATKTETWVQGPDGHRWEWYVRTGDSEVLESASAGCCGPGATCCAVS